jgi:hypothetical protein
MTHITVRVPEDIPQLLEVLVSMRLTAPKFLDDTGYFPYKNLDYAFRQLNAGLDFNRPRLGEERYRDLIRMSGQIRALFEADPDDKTGQTHEGCIIILAMEDMLRQPKRRS